MADILTNPNPLQLTVDVRETPVPQDRSGIERYFPRREVFDIEFELDQVDIEYRAATYRAFGAPVKLDDVGTMERSRGGMLPLGKGYTIDEKNRIRLAIAAQGGGSDTSPLLINQITNFAQRGRRAIDDRLLLAQGRVLRTGKFTLAAEDGLTDEADFGVDPTRLAVTPATGWNDTANADFIRDLQSWSDEFEGTAGEGHGSYPSVAKMSRATAATVMRHTKLQGALASNGSTPTFLTVPVVNQFLSSVGLPIIEVEQVSVTDYDGTNERSIIDGQVTLLPDGPIGETLLGVTAESLDLVEGGFIEDVQDAAGITAVAYLEANPYRKWVVVNAIGLPVITMKKSIVVCQDAR